MSGAACQGRDILAIQDTTVTRADGSSGGGSVLHAMIAVDAQSGAVLGAVDAQFLARSAGGKASRLDRPLALRQSIRWLQATELAGERAGDITGAARVMMVADREADIFDLFARRPAHVDGPMSMYWCGQRMTAPWQMAADWPGRLAGQIGRADWPGRSADAPVLGYAGWALQS